MAVAVKKELWKPDARKIFINYSKRIHFFHHFSSFHCINKTFKIF